MMELEEAIERILATIPAPMPEEISLRAGPGRYLAEAIHAPINLPAFDNSAMDGYAVLAENLRGANAEKSVTLRLIGRAAAGEIFPGEVATGTCVRIFTGSPLPRGADAVIMQEDSRIDLADSTRIIFSDSVKPWENVRLRGEDVKAGTLVAESGMEVTAARLSLLAALGLQKLKVGKRPRVALLATGSELIEAGESLSLGQIYESNRSTLEMLVSRAGASPKIQPLVSDTLEGTKTALENSFAENDIVITSGGVSVGEMDFVKAAFESLGGTLDFWKVEIRPGRPFVFGRWGEKFLFGLPGNPVSAFITFLLLARPALLKWQGATQLQMRNLTGTLAQSLTNSAARRHFLRVNVDNEGNVRSAGTQASHALSSLAAANGLLDMPPKTTWAQGAKVKVQTWD